MGACQSAALLFTIKQVIGKSQCRKRDKPSEYCRGKLYPRKRRNSYVQLCVCYQSKPNSAMPDPSGRGTAFTFGGQSRRVKNVSFHDYLEAGRLKRLKPNRLEIKIDPGSKVTGIALVLGEKGRMGCGNHTSGDKQSRTPYCLVLRFVEAGEAEKTRYRQPRFLNRNKAEGLAGFLPCGTGF